MGRWYARCICRKDLNKYASLKYKWAEGVYVECIANYRGEAVVVETVFQFSDMHA